MRALLVENERAGRAPRHDVLVDGLVRAGFAVDGCIDAHADDATWGRALGPRTDVVVAAGGDGTVARVGRRLLGTSTPLAVVPTGTANNLARALGVVVDARSAIDGLSRARERRLDLGRVRGLDGDGGSWFFEAFGVGAFAAVLAAREADRHKEPRRGFQRLADEIERHPGVRIELRVGSDRREETCVLAAAMNVRTLGPGVELACEARCDDGELDFVVVRSDRRDELVTHLRRAAAGGTHADARPCFDVVRARQITMTTEHVWAHLDDKAKEVSGEVTIDVVAGALRVLVPSA